MMTGEEVPEDNSGTVPFNGFASLNTNAPTYLSPFFNKAGVTTEQGRAKDVVDHTATEWRKIVTRYSRGIKVVISNFSSVI